MPEKQKSKLIVILGPTAVGKTKLSIDIAKALRTEIISGDSMLLYKGFNIGTAKPTPAEMDGVKHHLIDILEPQQNFNLADFLQIAKPLIADINAQGRIPILAGGTGLYVKSQLEGYELNTSSGDPAYRAYLEKLAQERGRQYVYDMLQEADPQTAKRLLLNNFQRIIRALEVMHSGEKQISQTSYYAKTGELVYDACVIGLTRPREQLYERINQRVDMMMADGFADEVKHLLAQGVQTDWQPMKAIGYKEMARCINGEISREQAVSDMKKATRHFAKRQFTWYRKMPYIKWLDADAAEYKDLVNITLSHCKELSFIIK